MQIKKIPQIPVAITMKTMLIFAVAFSSFICCAQISVPGNKTEWTLVGAVPANTTFQIQGSGTVNFGCRLDECNDNVYAGVTGNSFVQWFKNNWGTIDKFLLMTAVPTGAPPIVLNAKVTMKPGETFSSYIQRKSQGSAGNSNFYFQEYIKKVSSEVHYDQGGFWVVMTTNDQYPQIGQNTFCEPALYYWYNKFSEELGKEHFNPNIQITQPVWVWALAHDGGRSAINLQTKDYHDNSGSYRVGVIKYL